MIRSKHVNGIVQNIRIFAFTTHLSHFLIRNYQYLIFINQSLTKIKILSSIKEVYFISIFIPAVLNNEGSYKKTVGVIGIHIYRNNDLRCFKKQLCRL